ncbi:uncharacterized protein [Elaeis guineensis]|uniref:Uncharacterized protein LOC105048086 n=1 Tax=Elaeis guineensis var. tenera TaxID=51953 RepID=A0A6I9RF76_ELAGV|nr:uncharacterized protein LOC105048086 [Elaeis guineensis]
MEGFSIREYTEKMRSVDFEKCWPFNWDGEGGETGRSLPPILSRKFRWWSDELRAARLAAEKPEGIDARVGLEKNADEKVIPIPINESMIETPPVEPPVDGNPVEAAAMAVAVAVEKEGKQVRVPSRGKQRAPKKRSIVELFAVAPPVDTLEDDASGSDVGREADREDGEERDQQVEMRDLGSGDKSGGESLEALRKRKVLDMKDDEKKQEKVRKIKEKIGKKTKKKKLKVEICAAKKEKIGKSKMPSPVDISHMLQNKLHDKRLKKIRRNLIDGQKKSVTVKSLPKKHNLKLIQTSKLISRNQKEVTRMFPLRSILKNRKGGTSIKKGKTISDTQDRNFIKLCCKSAKHVSFSGKDDTFGLKRRCSTIQLPHLQNLCKIFSDVLAASSAMDNLSKGDKCPHIEGAQVVNASDKDLARSNVERSDGTLSEEKQSNGSYDHAIPHSFTDPSKRKSPETKRTPLSEAVDLNHAVQDISELSCLSLSSTMSPTHAYSGDTNVLNPIHEAGSSCDARTHREESSQRMSNAIVNLHGPIGKCVPKSTAASSLTLSRSPILQHSPSCLEKGSEASKEQHLQCVDPTPDFCSHRQGFQPVHHHSPKGLISGISSSVRSKEFGESRLMSDLMSTCREKSVDKDFIGLPLNSQGELMQLHSNTKFVCSDFYEKQNLVGNSVCSFPDPNYVEPRSSQVKMKGKFPCESLYQKDPLSWSMEQYYPAGKVVTSGMGFTDLQGFEIMEIQNRENQDFDQIIHRETNQTEVSCCGCTECYKTENYIDRVNFHVEKNLDNRFQPAIEPTMRLMGKNVAVGRSNEECLGFNDGKRWSVNELVAQNCPSVAVSGKPFMKRWPQGESVEHAEYVSSKENLFKSLEVPSSFYCMPVTEFSSNPMHLNFHPQWMSRSSAIGSHGYNADLFFHSIPQQSLKKTSSSAVNCNSVTQHVTMGHQQPVVGPYPQNVSQHMLLNSPHCKHSQSVPYSMSTFHPAFPDQECRSLSRTSIAHSPPTLPHWLLNATHQKKIQQPSCPYSDPLSANQPSIIRGKNVFPFSSPYPAPIISLPFYGSNTLPGPVPMVHHLAIPALGANKSRPAGNTSRRSKKKNNNGTKFEFANAKVLDLTNKTRKRPAVNDDTSVNTLKKANLNMQEGSNVPIDSGRREQMHGHSKCNVGSSEINAYGSKITDRESMLHLGEKGSMVATSGSGAPNFNPQERSGFVKLSGGAKHMLKPCQDMDQDKSRPVHSTVPFAVGTTSDREPVSPSKASKLYRF